jgi:hypothetical protein
MGGELDGEGRESRVRVIGRTKHMEERAKRFLERIGFSMDDIDRPGFGLADPWIGRSLIDRTAPKRRRLSKQERAKRFRESVGIDVSQIGEDGFYLVDRLFGRRVMENPPDSFIVKAWRKMSAWLLGAPNRSR